MELEDEDSSSSKENYEVIKKKSYERSARDYKATKKLIPSGSSSIMRTDSWDPYPVYIDRGKGTRIWDVDGNEYIDFLMAFGPLINGHSNERVNRAIKNQLKKGILFGAPEEHEYELSKKFMKFVPNQDKVIFALSGTDATFNAIRISRAATGKNIVLKFEGHYHGMHDYGAVSVEAPPAVAGLKWFPKSLPYSAGIPAEVLDTVMVATWNDLEGLEKILRIHGNEIACIIMEPIMANSTVINPDKNYLKGVRELADEYDIVLIFDEVITGFRVSEGGAQKLYGIEPDLSTWAKALGNGVPISAISGKAEFMDLIGKGVGYGGTYFSSSLSLVGAIENLKILEKNDFQAYRGLKTVTRKMAKGIEDVADDLGEKMIVSWETGMLSFVFTELDQIRNYRDSIEIDWDKYKIIQKFMLDRGMYYHPDNAERMPLSVLHTEEDVETFLVNLEESIKKYNTLF